jgi:ectoine hydroxylase-related dioxygenase (phytanoyl-CoA dioxygenase family)
MAATSEQQAGTADVKRQKVGIVSQGGAGVDVQARLLDRVSELALERNVAELDALGYTVVEDAAPLELFDRIRADILAVTQEVRDRGEEPFNFGPNTSMVYRLLAKSDAVAEAVLTPKLTALVGYLLGEGYVAQVATGSVLDQGAIAGPVHADNQFFPDPFPPQVHMATAIWCCDDFSGDLGSTNIVPGSNHRFRHPRAGEGLDTAVPVEAPRGSFVLWTGHTWHRSGGRTAPGQRVALHTGFSRPHICAIEGYEPDEVQRLVAFDDRFTRLLGADLPYGFTGDTPDVDKLIAIAVTTQAQA